jgi:hypothetical protein
MTIKMQFPLTTLPTANEQSGVSPLTVTAAGNSREYPELGAFSSGTFFLDVTAVSGTATPTLAVFIQGYNPIAEKWHDIITFTPQTAVTATVITPVTQDMPYQTYRSRWTVTGTTPSFTFSLGVIVSAVEATL